MRTLLGMAVILGVANGCTPKHTVAGVVVDADTLSPLSGVTVIVRAAHPALSTEHPRFFVSLTDDQGRFSLDTDREPLTVAIFKKGHDHIEVNRNPKTKISLAAYSHRYEMTTGKLSEDRRQGFLEKYSRFLPKVD